MACSSCLLDLACDPGRPGRQRPSLHRLEFGHVLPYLSNRSLQHDTCRVHVAVQRPSTAGASGGKTIGATNVDLTNYTLDSPGSVSPIGELNSLSVSSGHVGSVTFMASLDLSVVQGSDSMTAEWQMTSLL